MSQEPEKKNYFKSSCRIFCVKMLQQSQIVYIKSDTW